MIQEPFYSERHEAVFRHILWASLAVYGVLGLGVAVLKVKPPAPPDITQLPPRIAKLMIQPKPVAPPVPEVKPVEPAEEAPKEEDKPKEAAPEEKVEVASKPPLSPEELAEQQRRKDLEVAMKSGLLSLLKQSDMKPLTDVDKTFSEIKDLKSQRVASNRPGMSLKGAEASGGIDDIVNQLEKVLQNSKVVVSEKDLGTSGGIAAPDTGPKDDKKLKERKTTAVDSPFKIKGYGDGDSPRSYQEITLVVERYKGGISFLYNRALRRDPSLRGTVTVEFTIAASGEVIDCKVSTSSMEDPSFEEDLVKRILQWEFPPIVEGDVTVVYPLVFYVTG
jgi:periplasmic protein TonB